MPREYFPSKFHLDNRVRYFLWSSDNLGDDIDHDEVWTRNGLAPTFATLEHARMFACDELGLSPIDEGEPLLHDLTSVAHWLRLKKSHRARQVHARQCLAAWNIFSDLARSLHLPFRGDEDLHTSTWSKLLWGENSFSLEITDPRRLFRWTGAEIREIHAVLDEGLKLWRAHVR
jgi:hypothetical protein